MPVYILLVRPHKSGMQLVIFPETEGQGEYIMHYTSHWKICNLNSKDPFIMKMVLIFNCMRLLCFTLVTIARGSMHNGARVQVVCVISWRKEQY